MKQRIINNVELWDHYQEKAPKTLKQDKVVTAMTRIISSSKLKIEFYQPLSKVTRTAFVFQVSRITYKHVHWNRVMTNQEPMYYLLD